MKNFTGKVTNVDITAIRSRRNQLVRMARNLVLKKTAAVKKSSGKKPLKDITAVMTKKPVHKL